MLYRREHARTRTLAAGESIEDCRGKGQTLRLHILTCRYDRFHSAGFGVLVQDGKLITVIHSADSSA